MPEVVDWFVTWTRLLWVAVLTCACAGRTSPRTEARVDTPHARSQQRCAECVGKVDSLFLRELIAHLDWDIDDVRDAESAAPLVARLRELTRHRGFRMAQESPRHLGDVKGLVLTDWWHRGGRNWLEWQIPVEETSELWLEPDARTLLSPETSPGHPLARLLCPLQDADCGRETVGWYANYEARLRRWEGPIRGEHACSGSAQERGGERPTYAAWRQCIERIRPLSPMLPLGRFRAATAGWFVLRGRRGHYDFCDEIRVYGLEKGAAFVVSECAGLVIGDVAADNARTDGGRVPSSRRGTLPIDNLREAAWATMMESTVRPVQAQPVLVRRPMAIPRPTGPVPNIRAEVEPSPEVHISGVTELAWSWIVGGAVVAEGTIEWPACIACDLWEKAEAALRMDCPSTRPPWPLPSGRARPHVDRLDASPSSLVAAEKRLGSALQALIQEPCLGAAPAVRASG